ncbi:MAG: hypothetical protein C4529_00120 [Deltaproteobacteria bacterium]|nr:MAG: hypothetical protein C4529_00120 [Deltaproteobacteria bacterium]
MNATEAVLGLKTDDNIERLFPQWQDQPRFLEKLCRDLEIPVIGWHAFRHRKASQMAQEGRNLVEIQHWLGHDNATITSSYLQILGFSY